MNRFCHNMTLQFFYFPQFECSSSASAQPPTPIATIGRPVPAQLALPVPVFGFLGMFNYMTKFIPNTATHTHNIRALFSKKNHFEWTTAHENEFNELKRMVSSDPIVAFYDTRRDTRPTTDSSSYGLGGVLEHDDIWKPVYFCSKSLSQTEPMYAQIEKEVCFVLRTASSFPMI